MQGTGTTLDLEQILDRDRLACLISEQYQEYDVLRSKWVTDKRELQNYIFATDTSTTSNSKLPWKNKTTLPKLCQIRDNLHANYMDALFPNDSWLLWEGDDENSEAKNKRLAIQAYMMNKTRQSDFETTVSTLVQDYIDYGNCFATTEWVEEITEDEDTGEELIGYVGPVLRRISPMDIVFNPTAAQFKDSPKMVRSVTTLGALKREYEKYPNDSTVRESFEVAMSKSLNSRRAVSGISVSEIAKVERFQIDGFSSLHHYFGSSYVEVLDFYGDLYDVHEDKFYENYHIKIIDRSYVVHMKTNPRWLGGDGIHHVGWRNRQDNLYSMGPLDNLVGMQYRIDHLENLKADVFDVVAFPMTKIRGMVDDFEYGPNERIYVYDDGDVEFLRPDVTALNADTQIQILENKMEEMAGAPRQAMGIRTPGEKTKFEVQVLENATGRIFQNKTNYFERKLLRPVLNDMLELARRNISGSELVRILDSEVQAIDFLSITKEDLTARGKLRPTGASHFAQRANLLQNFVQFANSAIGQDPAVNVHISGKRMAELVEKLLDAEKYSLVRENIRVIEQAETQSLINSASQELEVEDVTPAGITEGDDGTGQI